VLGKVFGDNLEKIKGEVRTVTHVIVLMILVAVAVIVGVYLHRRQKRLMAEADVNEQIDSETLAHMPPQADLSTAAPPAAGAGLPPDASA